jgi:hypothetical protein
MPSRISICRSREVILLTLEYAPYGKFISDGKYPYVGKIGGSF